MVHYTCTSYDQYLPKLQRYAAVQAAHLASAGAAHESRCRLLFRGPLRFLQGYVWRLGFLDGMAGLQVCALVAYLSYLKHARLWELEHARPLHRLRDASDPPPAARPPKPARTACPIAVTPSAATSSRPPAARLGLRALL